MSDNRLFSNVLDVQFDCTRGLPLEFRVCKDVVFSGALAGEAATVKICRLAPRAYKDISLVSTKVEKGLSEISFCYEVSYDGEIAARFQLRYLLHHKTLTVTLEEVGECAGFELIEVQIPTLVSLHDHQSNEWIAHTSSTGHVVRLRDAKPGSIPDEAYFDFLYFGKTMATLPVVMFGQTDGACVMEVTSWMDGTLLRVDECEGAKTVAMGTVKKWRVDGSCSCQTNDDDLRVAHGNENTPNLIIEQKSSCRIDFVGDYDGNGVIDWVDCAKVVHERMPKLRTDYYDRRCLYIAALDHPGSKEPTLTFAEAAEHVKKVASLIDCFPQTVYLAGWQFDGHDTGYPAVSVIGNRIGGYEGYLRLKAEALKVNANISLDDNYDDAYLNSPEYDTRYIAKLPDGSLWRSRTWTRDTSAIIGLAKYMKGPGRKRVHYTTKRYRIKDSILVDVLSMFGIRNDWDPEHPASGVKNFLEGRYQVYEEYAKDGVDVISEYLRYPWVGRMNLCVNGPVWEGNCPLGGEPAPILALIYRNAILYGGWNTNDWARQIFFNGYTVCWFPSYGQKEKSADCAQYFYLSAVPGFKLRRLEMTGYYGEGDTRVVELEEDSRIEVNLKDWSYKAFWMGHEITSNGSVYCPLDENRIAFYSTEPRHLQSPLPPDWSATGVEAKVLFEDHHEEWPFSIRDGYIHVDADARRPVIVYSPRKG